MYTMEKNKKVLIKKIEQIFEIIQINQKNFSKERIRKHNQKPEVGTKKLKYAQRPEVKARKREYNQKSEVKARKREYYYRWCQKNKEKMREHIQIPIEWDDTQICKNSKDIKQNMRQ
ncbi:hypothetical protein [Spiroplasma endosymbiont of Villa modesta]|uniref:hypothetical protein n=1 Tax=Spiroplasma endosymbiont of Villa modesta TaxID=3066293 RepID=UPI00313E49D2